MLSWLFFGKKEGLGHCRRLGAKLHCITQVVGEQLREGTASAAAAGESDLQRARPPPDLQRA